MKNFFLVKKGNWYGAFLIIFIAFLSTCSNSITHSLPKNIFPAQILWIKTFCGLLLLLGLNLKNLKKLLKTNLIHWHTLKALAGAIGNWFWIAALQILPLADCTALSLMSAFLTTAGAYYFFLEKSNYALIGSLLIGFIGVVLILKPSYSTVSFYAFYPLLSAIAFSFSTLIIKKVSIKDNSYTTLLYLLFFMMIFSFFPAISYWQSLELKSLIKLICIGVLYAGSQLALIEAYTHGTAAFLAPFKFSRFPLGIISGMIFFNEILEWKTIIGTSLIVMSYVYLIGKDKNTTAYFYDKKR